MESDDGANVTTNAFENHASVDHRQQLM